MTTTKGLTYATGDRVWVRRYRWAPWRPGVVTNPDPRTYSRSPRIDVLRDSDPPGADGTGQTGQTATVPRRISHVVPEAHYLAEIKPELDATEAALAKAAEVAATRRRLRFLDHAARIVTLTGGQVDQVDAVADYLETFSWETT